MRVMISIEDLDVAPVGGPPPGYLNTAGGTVEWVGSLAWAHEHGEHARTAWVAGRLAGARGVLLSDGSRCHVFKEADAGLGTWRRPGEGGAWIHGTFAIGDDDVSFQDCAVPSTRLPKRGTLGFDLLGSEEAMMAVKDTEFAGDLYGALCLNYWRKGASGREQFESWRRAADLIVAMRGLGEGYADFFMMGNEGLVTEEVHAMLSGLGWSISGAVDRPGAHRRAVGVVELCESRPAGETPGWYASWGYGLVLDGSLTSRMHQCAVSGRATQKEWEDFWELVDLDAD